MRDTSASAARRVVVGTPRGGERSHDTGRAAMVHSRCAAEIIRTVGFVQWPLFPTQPDGAQPGLLLPPPAPWAGEALPTELTDRLRPREVPVWVGRPVGPARQGLDWYRLRVGTTLAMFGALFIVVGVNPPNVVPAAVGGILTLLAGVTLAGPPIRRARRRRRTWWVLTSDRLGGLCLAKPTTEVWIERGHVKEVAVKGLRRDGTGTVIVKTEPNQSFENHGLDFKIGVAVGRVSDAELLAEQVRLLRYELS